MSDDDSPVENPLKLGLMILAFTLLFSVMSTLVKYAAQENIPVQSIMFWRYFFGGIPVVGYLLYTRNLKSALLTREWAPLSARALMGMLAMWCVFQSFAMLPLAEATTLHFASPFFMTLISILFLKEKVGLWRGGAIVTGFIGVLFILRPDFHGALAGQIIALCAAMIVAMNLLLIRSMSNRVSAIAMTLYVHLIGAACMLPLALMQDFQFTTQNFLLLISLGFCAGIAQIMMSQCYLSAPASYVSAFSYIQIVFVTFAGWLVFGDVPTHTFLLGSAIIVTGGVVIIVRESLLKRKIHVEPLE